MGVTSAAYTIECQPGEYISGTECSEYSYQDGFLSACLPVCLSAYHMCFILECVCVFECVCMFVTESYLVGAVSPVNHNGLYQG